MIRRLVASRRTRVALAFAGLLGLGWGSFEAVIRSDWLGDKIRDALLHEIEAATGASVSIEKLRFGDSRLSFEVEGLEIRDRGDGGAPPLLTVPRASVVLDWHSFIGRQTYLETLRVEEPLVRVRIEEDGSSNIPRPELLDGANGITVRHFELSGGSIDWNGEPHDMEFSGSGLEVLTTVDPATGQYAIDASLADPQWGAEGRQPLRGSMISVSAVAGSRGIEIHAAKLVGDALSFDAMGRLRNMESPQFEGSYSAMADLQVLVNLVGSDMRDLTGTVRAQGKLRWDSRSGQLGYDGRVVASNVAVSGFDAEGSFEAGVAGDARGE